MLQWSNMWKHFKKLLVHNPPLWLVTEQLMCHSNRLSLILILRKKSHPKWTRVVLCFSINQFLCFRIGTVCFQRSAPCCETPYQLLSLFHPDQIVWIFVFSDCSDCLHAVYHGWRTKEDFSISKILTSCNQYNLTQTDWKKKMELQ